MIEALSIVALAILPFFVLMCSSVRWAVVLLKKGYAPHVTGLMWFGALMGNIYFYYKGIIPYSLEYESYQTGVFVGLLVLAAQVIGSELIIRFFFLTGRKFQERKFKQTWSKLYSAFNLLAGVLMLYFLFSFVRIWSGEGFSEAMGETSIRVFLYLSLLSYIFTLIFFFVC